MRRGFSLVELSIVLVILGLLVGGILAGQSLIKAAELRTVGTDAYRFMTVTHAFRDKYMGLPGDLTNATSFWGELNATAADCRTGATPAGSTATCNGDGNKMIESWRAPASMENFRYWQHLSNAGLIEGRYTGTTGAGHASEDGNIGINVPAARIANTGYSMNPLGAVSGSTYYYDGNYGNTIQFGTDSNGMYGPALLPEEAWNMDTKLDDGAPAAGKVRSFKQGSPVSGSCTLGTTSTATYALELKTKECAINFVGGF